ncbi:hypothetical protein C0991_006989 [Blastosporella zonata]|nr:hypothetical protein C0991_006989 [Blastosporella zonata]
MSGKQYSVVTQHEDWARSDEFHNSFLHENDPILDAALANSRANELPEISVSAAQGKLLKLLAISIGAKRILEIGTLGGYSTIWLGRALPEDGHLITLELDEKHARVARENLLAAGLSSKAEVIVGIALDSLANLHPEVLFDFIFIDADKPSNVAYFTEAKRLVRKGGIIVRLMRIILPSSTHSVTLQVVDNVVMSGRVADPSYTDEMTVGVRDLLAAIKGDKEVDATTIATVGKKGYDGFLYAVRT